MLIFLYKKRTCAYQINQYYDNTGKKCFFLLWKSLKFDRTNLKKKLYNILLFELWRFQYSSSDSFLEKQKECVAHERRITSLYINRTKRVLIGKVNIAQSHFGYFFDSDEWNIQFIQVITNLFIRVIVYC